MLPAVTEYSSWGKGEKKWYRAGNGTPLQHLSSLQTHAHTEQVNAQYRPIEQYPGELFWQTPSGHFVNQYPAKIFWALTRLKLQVVLSVRRPSSWQNLKLTDIHTCTHTHTHTHAHHSMPASTSDPLCTHGSRRPRRGHFLSNHNPSSPNCCCYGDRGIRLYLTAELTKTLKTKKSLLFP